MASRRIVLGLDGSPGSDAALRWCAGSAPALGSVPHHLSHHASRPVLVVPSN